MIIFQKYLDIYLRFWQPHTSFTKHEGLGGAKVIGEGFSEILANHGIPERWMEELINLNRLIHSQKSERLPNRGNHWKGFAFSITRPLKP